MERKRVIVWRDNTGGSGLGLSIAGGIESTPFIVSIQGRSDLFCISLVKLVSLPI
jgi:hypothetical protein